MPLSPKLRWISSVAFWLYLQPQTCRFLLRMHRDSEQPITDKTRCGGLAAEALRRGWHPQDGDTPFAWPPPAAQPICWKPEPTCAPSSFYSVIGEDLEVTWRGIWHLVHTSSSTKSPTPSKN